MPDFILSEDIENNYLSMATMKDGWANKFLENIGPAYHKVVEVLQEECAIIPTGILPDGVTWMSPDRRFILWTQPPKRKVVDYIPLTLNEMSSYTAKDIEDRTRSYAIPFPHHGFAIHLDANYCVSNAYMYLTLATPPSGELGKVAIPPLHNLYADGRICFSKHSLEMFKDRNKFPTIRDILYGVHDAFWNSTLNNDTVEAYASHLSSLSGSTGLRRFRTAKLGQGANDMINPNIFYSNWQRLSLKEAGGPNIAAFFGIRHMSLAHLFNSLSPQQNDSNYHHVILWYKITNAMKKANDLVAGNSV